MGKNSDIRAISASVTESTGESDSAGRVKEGSPPEV